MNIVRLISSALPVFFLVASATAEDNPGLFEGAVRELGEPIHIQARPAWMSACVLRQTVRSQDDEPAQQIVTFDTHVEGNADSSILVQTVAGHEGSEDSPATFGYQHRVTMDRSGVPVSTEARAIAGFPIATATLRQAALDGKVDIRDSIFSGRTFRQGDPINRNAEETFRFLKPVLPRDLTMDALVEHKDESRVVGLIDSSGGRPTLLFRVDIDSTTMRRSSATNTVLRGSLLLDVESGLIAGEDWSVRIDRTSEDPFEIVTKVDCSLGPKT
ncbi:MAG: hypothetical protein O3C65_07845 [Proteobacteria bacterium]|nr:hypothetical protein [Pseudomonadota bacterium]MDA1058585.1 hypothetical protein [Pseudomonadota bacterium]